MSWIKTIFREIVGFIVGSTVGSMIIGAVSAAGATIGAFFEGLPYSAMAAIAIGVFCLIMIVLLLVKTKSKREIQYQLSEAERIRAEARVEDDKQNLQRDGVQGSKPDRSVPCSPIFGCPRQGAGEPFFSWWHIPVTVDGGDDSPNGRIENCTVHLATGSGLPANLQWQSDSLTGTSEITLLEGRTRVVPVAARCEQSAEPPENFRADGIARITGTTLLVHKEDKNVLQVRRNKYVFRLIVRSGTNEWKSQEYVLRVPNSPTDSNGQFNLEEWHGGTD